MDNSRLVDLLADSLLIKDICMISVSILPT